MIDELQTDEDIFYVLRQNGMDSIAEDFERYADYLRSDESASLALDSLRDAVSFLVSAPELRKPFVGSYFRSGEQGVEGVHLEWHWPVRGGAANAVVSLRFPGKGVVQYVALSDSAEVADRIKRNGTTMADTLLSEAIPEFVPFLVREVEDG